MGLAEIESVSQQATRHHYTYLLGRQVRTKIAGRPIYIGLGSQFILLDEKVRSKEAGTHGFEPTSELTRRQVLNASEEIITHKIAEYFLEDS